MNIAFIPVRGGSKSIPLKNIKKICGRPLVYWVSKAANDCLYIDKVYVATDSELISEVVKSFHLDKVEVIGRSRESASDTASTEAAMLEFAEKTEFDNIVLIQATSPLLQASDLDQGFLKLQSPDCDSVMSVVPQKRFYWKYNEKGNIDPLNYDVYARPRRQDFDGSLTENGAFYITSRENLLKTKNRVSGNIKAVEMMEDSFFEIDEPFDWLIIEALMKKNGIYQVNCKIDEIKMFLTDSDGCLTDGGMYYSESGDELKKFNTLDGKAFSMLKERGIITGIITGENVNLVQRRAEKLNIDILELGANDKLEKIKYYCKKYNIELNQVVYVGDDVADIEAIKAVGFGCAVRNAMEEVKAAADYVTDNCGGSGAIREIVNRILGI